MLELEGDTIIARLSHYCCTTIARFSLDNRTAVAQQRSFYDCRTTKIVLRLSHDYIARLSHDCCYDCRTTILRLSHGNRTTVARLSLRSPDDSACINDLYFNSNYNIIRITGSISAHPGASIIKFYNTYNTLLSK